MDWLEIESEQNQDMNCVYIGPLVMRDGFKVRYRQIELYTDEIREKFKSVFSKQGYDISIKYNNTYAYCEVVAVKKENRYGDIAMVVAISWAIYRVYMYMTHV